MFRFFVLGTGVLWASALLATDPAFKPADRRGFFDFDTGVLRGTLRLDGRLQGIETLINSLGMVPKIRLWGDPEPVYYRSSWVRANNGGILLAEVSLGSTVRKGDLLGTITDPMNNARSELRSPHSGRIIGMARNQVVMPGFAAFHVGIQTDDTATMQQPVAGSVPPAGREDGAYTDSMSE